MHLRKVSNDRRTFKEGTYCSNAFSFHVGCCHSPPSCQSPRAALRSSDQLVPSLLYCCECKQPRVVELALGSLQRLVKHHLLPKVSTNFAASHTQSLSDAAVGAWRWFAAHSLRATPACSCCR